MPVSPESEIVCLKRPSFAGTPLEGMLKLLAVRRISRRINQASWVESGDAVIAAPIRPSEAIALPNGGIVASLPRRPYPLSGWLAT